MTEANINTAQLEVNKFARRARHLRVFSKIDLVKIHAVDFVKWMVSPVLNLRNTAAFNHVADFFGIFSKAKDRALEVMPIAPQRKLLFNTSAIALTALIISSFSPGATLAAPYTYYSQDYIDSYSLPGDVLVSDENGYLVKINPQTDDSNRIGLTDYAVHTIESGESLSVIAARYGISVETIIWENNLVNANSIRSGQKLLIPPVDGISYKIEKGDTLDKLAEKYKISKEVIIAQNGLESETLVKGQNIFLPGAKPILPARAIAATNYRAPAASRNARVSGYAEFENSDASPARGKVFIYPTTGKITQGFIRGHYALDIADRSKPAVWAAGGGTVTKVSTGTWGGGYGNHIIIDHGDGLQTLYAHLDSVSVSEGDYVNQGDVIGQMGNTGRVYGATGIHLHWEVIDNGVKKNPANYY